MALGGLLAALLSSAVIAETLKGVALAIGQSDYGTLTYLDNTRRDAKGMEDLLARLGFKTDAAVDRGARQLSRDLEDFVEDAIGADVAVLYYAGHMVEVGGQNYLLPTDIDASSPEALASGLVPLANTVEALRRNTKLVIVLLDACRDNPLPPGTTVRLTPEGEPQAVTMVGAGTRGVTMLSRQSDPSTGSLGVVIGFAAESGKTALDGEPGGNSPYTAALLRHIPAMAGAEFGQVMRMVTQEVYLKTNGRQRPWVNESLRQLLYFGESAPDPTGDEGDILKERRQLLLTIADLDAPRRKQVERIAAEGGVPMDAVYGMLRAMGSEVPQDPAELDAVLKAQAERLKAILAERAVLASPDAEIVRLSALADKALAEGALDANLKFREAAKARFAAIKQTLDSAEEELSARRLEGGAVLAATAEAHELRGDYAAAADNYAQSFAQVERWDRQTAWRYKLAEADALQTLGGRKGDNEALTHSIAAYDLALTLAPRGTAHDGWAMTQNNLGNALSTLGERESGTATLEQAVEAYHAALEERSRARVPLDWAMTQNNLGTALWKLGEIESDTTKLKQAVAAYRAALEEWTRDRVPLHWAMTQNNIGTALATLGLHDSDRSLLEQALEAYRAALGEWTRERVPLDWAMAKDNIGNVLSELGRQENDTARLEQTIEAYRAALQERNRTHVPLLWGTTQQNLGSALSALGERESGTAALEQAVEAYRAALKELTLDRVPLDWAAVQANLGDTLVKLGKRLRSAPEIEQGRDAIAAAWKIYREAGFMQYREDFQRRIAAASFALVAIE